MPDIYDEAIQATMEYDNIRSSWLAGGDTGEMYLHGLLFRTCPHLNCCLTEYKLGFSDETIDYSDIDKGELTSEVQQLLDDLRDDDLMPLTQWKLEQQWDEADTEARIALLKRFAMYNRELDAVFDRKPQELVED